MKQQTKLLVMGLDAGTWNIIKPLIDDGKLPTLEKLVKSGAVGDLESSMPFFTSPAWKCYSTGKNPGKLGAYAWFNFDKKNKKLKLNNSTSFRGKELWDYLGENQFRCGVINMPQTYPVKDINGFMIAGLLAFDDSNYTMPKELKNTLKDKYNYKISPSYDLHIDTDEAIHEIKELIKMRFSVAIDMYKSEKPHFLHTTIFYIDDIQHYFWKYLNCDHKYSTVIEDCWKLIDAELGQFLDAIEDKINLVIISDHGATKLKGTFYMNKWLQDNGYLTYLKNPFGLNAFNLLGTFGINRELVLKIVQKFGLYNLIRLMLPDDLIIKIQHNLESKNKQIEIGAVLRHIDWDNTKAIAVSEQCVYVTAENDSEIVKASLIKKMKGIVDPRTGEKIIRDVKLKEDIYHGDYVEVAPDLIIDPEEGYRIYDGIVEDNQWNFTTDGWSGYHKQHGILIANGPDFKRGYTIENAHIYDIAPTILHLFGISIPSDIDGKILTDIFNNSEIVKRKIIHDKKTAIKNNISKLKNLGKI